MKDEQLLQEKLPRTLPGNLTSVWVSYDTSNGSLHFQREDVRAILQRSGLLQTASTATLSVLQSRSADKLLRNRLVYPQNGTAVLLLQ